MSATLDIEELKAELSNSTPQAILQAAVKHFGDELVMACSFGEEDTALLDMLAKIKADARVFLLDTGRLPEETYEVWNSCRTKYPQIRFEIYAPEAGALQSLLAAKGPYSFYESIENRKECCGVRKVEPLGRALTSASAWITGMRREQSVTRTELHAVEVDEVNGGILKFNPLFAWSSAQVQEYNQANNVPVHPLHAKGYPSIGCAPCTRAISPGEDPRAGRWWWESADTKECGLHAR